MNDYKGLYYNDDNEQAFYEGGAHFKYIDLYRKLERLLTSQTKVRQHSTTSQKVFLFI